MNYEQATKVLARKRIRGEITQAQYLHLIQQLKKRFGEKSSPTPKESVPKSLDITNIDAVVSFFGSPLDSSNQLG